MAFAFAHRLLIVEADQCGLPHEQIWECLLIVHLSKKFDHYERHPDLMWALVEATFHNHGHKFACRVIIVLQVLPGERSLFRISIHTQ